VTLIFDIETLKLVRTIDRGMGNLSTNFGISGTYYPRLMGQHRALELLLHLSKLEVTSLVSDTGVRAPSVYQVSCL